MCPQANHGELAKKAARFQEQADHFWSDANGVIYSSLNARTQEPWTPADWSDRNDYFSVKGYEPWEFINYENSGMTTGAYLAAVSHWYRVTGDRDVLARARRAFEGICWIYELGRQKEDGYFPKPYGGRYSEEASTDQYLYVMKAMMAYLDIAADDHRSAIRHMIPNMVDFWVKRHYRRTYFGIEDMLWPLGRFPALLLMARQVSGESRYLDEFHRLNEQEKVYEGPADSLIQNRLNNPDAGCDYEKKHGGYLLGHSSECSAMDIMELDECLLRSDAYRDNWLASMKMVWHEGKLDLAENGYAWRHVLYDPRTGKVSVPEPCYVVEAEPLGWSFQRWVGRIQIPRSTMLARVAPHVNKWLPGEDAPATMRKILSGIDPAKVCDYIDTDGQQILPQHKFLTQLISGDAITNWLWAYWLGRADGIIGDDE